MVKRKLRPQVKFALAFIGIVIMTVIFMNCVNSRRDNTVSKLKKIGYSKEEIQYLKTLEKETIEPLLELEYNPKIVSLLKEPYFLMKNLNRYLEYAKKNSNLKVDDIVSLVNVNRDRDYYTNTTKANTTLGNGILVNKYYYIEESYAKDSVIGVNLQYAYGDNYLQGEVIDAFITMYEAAKKEGHQFIINTSYRSYDWQEEVYEGYKERYDEEYADEVASRPGYSEHQTGLALHINTYPSSDTSFENTEDYQWLIENSYRYGFILRYPKDKENVTGYAYEPNHFRYVGMDLARKIYESGLTFDEYYAYYLEK